MLKKVKLYGELADFVGHKELDAVINTTADAIRFLVTNFEGLHSHMATRTYQVLVDNYDIGEEEIHHPIGSESISIVPVISGSGSFGRILLGGALLALSFGAFGAFGANALTFGKGFSASFAAASFGAKAAFGIGGALVLSGVSDLLFPLPKFEGLEEDPRVSFSFSGVQNTDRAGTSIPLCYGEIVTGSVVISAGIDTQQIVAGDS